MIDLIFFFIGEFLGQLIAELAVELSFRRVLKALGIKKLPHPILSALGYICLAVLMAGISLSIYRDHLIRNNTLQIINLSLTPLLAGFLMAMNRRRLEGKDLNPIRLDSFWYGYLFALTFAMTRYFYAT